MPTGSHAGPDGFSKRTSEVAEQSDASVTFILRSPDGDQGFPGALECRVRYSWSDDKALRIDYSAVTDKLTVVNLTNHVYWNLTGDPRRLVTGHQVRLESDAVLEIDAGLIPTGTRLPVKKTPFDFTSPTEIGRHIDAANAQLKAANGYDHCWILRGEAGLRLAARVHEPVSGRTLELFTDQPGLQLYTGNFLDGTAKGKGGAVYPFRTAFCLEPQRFPDAPNQPPFPSATLRPGEVYEHKMMYRFSVE